MKNVKAFTKLLTVRRGYNTINKLDIYKVLDDENERLDDVRRVQTEKQMDYCLGVNTGKVVY